MNLCSTTTDDDNSSIKVKKTGIVGEGSRGKLFSIGASVPNSTGFTESCTCANVCKPFVYVRTAVLQTLNPHRLLCDRGDRERLGVVQ